MSNLLLFSTNPDTLLFWFYQILIFPLPVSTELNRREAQINLFIDKSSIGSNCNLIQYAKNEYTTLTKKIQSCDIPLFNVSQDEQSADFIIKIYRKHIKIEGVRRSVLSVKWIATATSDIIWEKGLSITERKYGRIDTLPGIEGKGIIPCTKHAQVLLAPGFLKECAYTLLFKKMILAN